MKNIMICDMMKKRVLLAGKTFSKFTKLSMYMEGACAPTFKISIGAGQCPSQSFWAHIPRCDSGGTEG